MIAGIGRESSGRIHCQTVVHIFASTTAPSNKSALTITSRCENHIINYVDNILKTTDWSKLIDKHGII